MNYNLIDKGPDITRIDISFGSVKKIPILPLKLERLYADNNPELEEFPIMPSTLLVLSICLTGVCVLPPLPKTLEELYISDNPGIIVEWLPENLKIFVADSCELELLPELPSQLTTLSVDNNYLECLPILPETLETLIISNNEFEHLSTPLPENLKICLLQNNRLNKLPRLPSTLLELNCSENELSRLPYLPSGLTDFTYFGNPLIYEFHNNRFSKIDYINKINRFVAIFFESVIRDYLYKTITKRKTIPTDFCNKDYIVDIPYFRNEKQVSLKSMSSFCSTHSSSISLCSLVSIDPWSLESEDEFVFV